jgi:hypothetical protein
MFPVRDFEALSRLNMESSGFSNLSDVRVVTWRSLLILLSTNHIIEMEPVIEKDSIYALSIPINLTYGQYQILGAYFSP